jgi:glutathione S-transferase
MCRHLRLSGAVGYGSFETAINALEQAICATPYLAGETFSAADIYTGSLIGLGLRFGTIEPRLAFTEYWARISTRPAAIRAAALDDALLTQQA